jgi:hypothetical protein
LAFGGSLVLRTIASSYCSILEYRELRAMKCSRCWPASLTT